MDFYINGHLAEEDKNGMIKVTHKMLITPRVIKENEPQEYNGGALFTYNNADGSSIDVIKIRNSFFYLPLRKNDVIQSFIYGTRRYFESGELGIIKDMLPQDATVIDAGANIGNHTLFYANECGAKKIYSFEPIPKVFAILEKNMEINDLSDRVVLYNIGLADEITRGSVKSVDDYNLMATNLTKEKTNSGVGIKFTTIDSLNISEKVNLIKIDVERMETYVLKGAEKTIREYKPIIQIESFPEEHEADNAFFNELEYVQYKDLGNFEYIYVHESSPFLQNV